MSLINEALKRTQAEKNGNAEAYSPPPMPAAHEPHRRGARSSLIVVVSALATFAAGLAGWHVLRRHRGAAAEPPPSRHVAAAAAAAGTAQVPRPAPLATKPEFPESTEPDAESVRTVARTMAAIRYYRPPDPVEAPRPPAAPPEAPAEPPKPARPTYKLSGVLTGNAAGTAIVNDRFVTVGDVIDGAEVVRITKHAVVLRRKGKTFTVGM
jgi:hypothetical protein